MINYDLLIKKNKWIVSKNQSCILSPDFDGLLCGLFMSFYFNWEIAGFYDGKNMIINQNKDYNDCVFLDMEILVKNIKSIGHHMLIYT